MTTWHYLILTASDEAQAAAFRDQIDVRRELGLLQGFREVLVVADPDGRRVGSGGSTLHCLLTVLNRELAARGDAARPETWIDVLRRMRILIMHCGGDSQRLPAYGPCGKVFVPVPDSGDSAVGTTLFDRQLPVYQQLPAADPLAGQIVIASGDVLLAFDPDEVRFAPVGITGLACAASPQQASHHGVYCAGAGGRLRRFLQKPTPAEQSGAGAVDDYGQSLLDVGVIHFDAETAVRMLALCGVRPRDGSLAWGGPVGDAIVRLGLDFYREVCCALGDESTLDAYIAAVRSSGSRWDDALLGCLHQAVAGIPCRMHTLSRCDFLHFGTTRQIITSGRELLRRAEGFAAPNVCLDINNQRTNGAELVASDAWIEGCTIADRVVLPGENVVVGADIREPLALPPHGCLDLLPGRSRAGDPVTFVRCYHTRDPLHQPAGEDTSFCGLPFRDWLAASGAALEDLWAAEVPPQERRLWNARLFPAVSDAGQYHRWLWMLEPGAATVAHWKNWLRAERYSLEEMAGLADRDAFRHRRSAIRGAEFLQSLPRYFRPESGFSAADLAHLLGHAENAGQWLAQILQEARRRAEKVDTEAAGDTFAFSRILHTVGSAVRQIGERHGLLASSSLPCLREVLGPQLAGSPELEDGDSPEVAPLAQWAGKACDLAFHYLRKQIVASGSEVGGPPHSALRSDEIVWGRVPVRLDLAGGWTDTPPYSLEHGGCVLNAAVNLNGQPPIQVYARVAREPVIRLRSIDVGSDLTVCGWDELLDYGSVTGEFALAKAALAISGFSPDGSESSGGRSLRESLIDFGGGIELTSLAAVPKGSGLGTSSIMGAVLLAVIHRVLGRQLNSTELFHGVLRLEQVLTTGGGWQDQIGGSVGGLKLITTPPGPIPEATIRYVPADLIDPQQNGGLTLLYYTGITRLAKNILQEVVGRYLDRDREAVAVLEGLPGLARQLADAIARKDLPEFGRLIGRAWESNKQLDPNCTSGEIEDLLARVRPYTLGAKLLGAGGGGFLLMVCKSAADAGRLRERLEADPPNARARFFEFAVSPQGLEVSVC